MNKVYIFGHRSSDTDSITSAISLAYLKKQLGMNAEARTLSELNNETKFVLNYFDVLVPKYLNDVKLQIKDVDYRKECFILENSSLKETYDFMVNNNITGVPIINDKKEFVGLITVKIILKQIFNFDNTLFTSYRNIIDTLDGKKILKFNDEVNGHIKAVAYKSTTFINDTVLTSEDILIVGDRHSVIESAIKKRVKLIIITGGNHVKDEHIILAKENKVNIIETDNDTFNTVKKISFANYVKNYLTDERNYTALESDYYDSFLLDSKGLGYNNYPVINKNGVCRGLIRVTDKNIKNRKKVILVDHNEFEQSAIGIEESEIIEVIDHHRIGDIITTNPINFRNMAVGSTNTIIYFLFKENRVEIPCKIAGLMLAGIISDTLALTSPTTTLTDKKVIKELEKITEIDYKNLASLMFDAASDIAGKSIVEIINTDVKTFETNQDRFKVSVITTVDSKSILEKKESYIEELDKMEDFTILLVTDILKNGSYILYSKSAYRILNRVYDDIYEGMFIKGLLSRKKQFIPLIIENLN